MNFQNRTTHGQLGGLVLFALVLIAMLGGALAVDVSHMSTSKQQLQRACDAAALGGALNLFRNESNVTSQALKIAESNRCDGRPVSNSTPDTVVTAELIGTPPTAVRVVAQMQVEHLLFGLLNRRSDTVRATSVAGGPAPMWTAPANYAFPIAVSLDADPRKAGEVGKPLKDMVIGDTIRIFMGSQQFKNAAFTSFQKNAANANYIRAVVEQSLDLANYGNDFIPSVSVGDQINLNNGIIGEKKLAQEPYKSALTSEPYFILPVIKGDPPMNQSQPVIGFISVKFTGVEVNQKGGMVEELTGTLVSTIAPGAGKADPQTPMDPEMAKLSVQTVHLLE